MQGPSIIAHVAALLLHGMGAPSSWLRKYVIVQNTSARECEEIQARLRAIVGQIAEDGLTEELAEEVMMLRNHLNQGIRDMKELHCLAACRKHLLRYRTSHRYGPEHHGQ